MSMIVCPLPLYNSAPTTCPLSSMPYFLATIYAYPQSWAIILKPEYKSRRSERIQLETNFPQHQPSGQKEKWSVPSASLVCTKYSFWETG